MTNLLARIAMILAVTAASVLPAAATDATTLERAIQPLVDRILEAGAPGIVVLRRDGDEVFHLAAGLANLAPATPIAATDRLRAGSLVKTFVAVLAMQLVEESALALEAQVEQLVPGVVGGRSITVRQLLNHTSGLFDYWQDESFFEQLLADPAQPWSPHALIELALRHPPLHAPGEAWSYSNTNYIALGLVIEAVTGKPLQVEMATRVFEPLGLGQTSFEVKPEISGTHARGYALLGAPEPVDVTGVNPSAAWAAGGGLVSTADDLARFYAGLMTGRLVATASLEEMLTTVPAREGIAYGLGIAEVDLSCGTAWGHQGEFPGYLGFGLTSRDGARQAVVLVNFYSLTESGQADFRKLVDVAFCS